MPRGKNKGREEKEMNQSVMEDAYIYQTIVHFERLVEELGPELVVAALAPPIRMMLLNALEKK